MRIEYVASAGITAPSDNYDIYLRDRSWIDVSGGVGVNLDEAVPAQKAPIIESGVLLSPLISGPLIADGTNVGAANEVMIWLEMLGNIREYRQ